MARWCLVCDCAEEGGVFMAGNVLILSVPVIDHNITNCFIPVCTENVVSMYLSYMNVEYEMIFSVAMDFAFSPDLCYMGRVADGLSVQYDSLYWLNYFYGISAKRRQFAFFSGMMRFIKKNLYKDKPCIIHLDSYFLPWSTYYRK